MYKFNRIAVDKAALWCAQRGIPVFPAHIPISSQTCSCGSPGCNAIGKHPKTRNGFRDATTDEKSIRGWIRRYGKFNLCAATGAASGFFVLDVDPDKGGSDSLIALQSQHQPLPLTWTSCTGGGGSHYLFRYPGYPVGNRTGFRPGLDIRGDDGYIVLPPSIHKSGRRYEWDPLCEPNSTELLEAPTWLLEEITRGAPSKSRSAAEWRRQFQEPLEEGERNSKITSLAGHLLRKGVDPYVTLELLTYLNATRGRPPLDDGELLRCVHSVVRRETQRRTGG